MKHLEGKTIYLIGTGNNKAREIIAGNLLKVGKALVTLKVGGTEYKYRIHPQKNEVSLDERNSGYLYFETIQDADNHLVRRRLAQKISEKIRYSSDIEKLPFEIVCAIADLLGV